jgi:hypothetical protein
VTASSTAASKQVRSPVWQAAPTWSTLTSRASPSQSSATDFTHCWCPDVSPFTQYSWRLRDQYVHRPVVRVRCSASSSIQPSISTSPVSYCWAIAAISPAGSRLSRAATVCHSTSRAGGHAERTDWLCAAKAAMASSGSSARCQPPKQSSHTVSVISVRTAGGPISRCGSVAGWIVARTLSYQLCGSRTVSSTGAEGHSLASSGHTAAPGQSTVASHPASSTRQSSAAPSRCRFHTAASSGCAHISVMCRHGRAPRRSSAAFTDVVPVRPHPAPMMRMSHSTSSLPAAAAARQAGDRVKRQAGTE